MRSWVIGSRGRAAWSSLLETMDHADRLELMSLVAVGWYDLGLQHRLLRAIDAEFGARASVIPVIGAYEAEQDLTLVHRLFLRLANPAFVLEKAGDYWGRFYDTGSWSIERVGAHSARAQLRNLDPFDESFAVYLAAYIRRMWELVGAKSLRTSFRVQDGSFFIEGSWRTR